MAGSFERETSYRILVEAVRHWCISNHLESGQVPVSGVFFVYADGPTGFDWGNAPGADDPATKPLRGKRYKVTIELEEHR
jgi:hypothetical protein